MDLDLQPILQGERIELRPLCADDFEALHAAASDPLIWEQHPERDRYKRDVFQKFFDSAIESGGAFAVIDKRSGRIIGSSRYCNLSEDGSEVEIGWTFLQREFWGGEYNREMKRLMLDHALPHVKRVVFVVGENNMRSRKALDKIGARFVRRRLASPQDGTEMPKVIYCIESSEDS